MIIPDFANLQTQSDENRKVPPPTKKIGIDLETETITGKIDINDE